MNRRDFTRRLARASLCAAVLPNASALGHLEEAFVVTFKLSVMLWTVYREMPFEQRLEKVAEAGYNAVELVDEFEEWSEEHFRRVERKKQSLSMTFDATAGLRKSLVDPSEREVFLAELAKLLPIADKLQCPAVIVLSGNKVSELSHEQQHQSCVEGLKRAGELAAKRNVTLLLENIDPEENPNYYLTSVAEGFEIVREVAHPHVKFLYDFYHEQIAEGNLIEKLEKNIDHVGLVHIADVPGRHAPGTGEINYRTIFRKLAELKYDRYAAMEFLPSGDPVSELRAARQMVAESASGERP